jgi:hypothetical protein
MRGCQQRIHGDEPTGCRRPSCDVYAGRAASPCQPDLLQPAWVLIDECGITPCSRCFLCLTLPPVASDVLATARPSVAHGCTSATRDCPQPPIFDK